MPPIPALGHFFSRAPKPPRDRGGPRGGPRLRFPWTHAGAAAAPAVSWWLAGEIDPSACVAAYRAIGAASLADSYINLANPGTYNAAPGVAPSWAAASGWTFNGTTQYLTTSYTPTATNHTVAVRYSNYTRDATYPRLLGAAKTGNQDPRTLIASHTTQSAWANGGSVKFLGTPLGTSGVAVVAAATAYLDGASIGALTTSGTALTCGLYIGAQNNGGVVGNYGSSTIQAVAIYNTTLTATQVAALTTAMQDLA